VVERDGELAVKTRSERGLSRVHTVEGISTHPLDCGIDHVVLDATHDQRRLGQKIWSSSGPSQRTSPDGMLAAGPQFTGMKEARCPIQEALELGDVNWTITERVIGRSESLVAHDAIVARAPTASRGSTTTCPRRGTLFGHAGFQADEPEADDRLLLRS
jgi:hypothetical protein